MNDTENNNKNTISSEDAAIWQKMTQDVKKMPNKTYIKANKTPVKQKKASIKPEKINETPILNQKTKQSTNTQSSEIAKQTDKRLRRGQIKIEATLDLHGQSKNDAYSTVTRFIQNAYTQQKRCVMIITGKGKANEGILRQNLPLWLQEDHLKPIILKTHQAQPKHGGSGAFYIYIRKNREN